MSIGLAFSVFFKVLGNRDFAGRLSDWMDRPAIPEPKPAAPKPDAPRRTEAVELLATLQREGRLVDFLEEKLDAYSDAQVGAAVRDIHRDCRATLQRLFAVEPLVAHAEGSTVTVPATPDPGQWKLTGRVGQGTTGRLCHHGWKITRHDLPAWSGSEAAAWVVAPADVEIT